MKLKVRNNEGEEHLFGLIDMLWMLPVRGEVYVLNDSTINIGVLRVYAGEEIAGTWYRIEFKECAEDFARWYVRKMCKIAYITVDRYTVAGSRRECSSYSVSAGQFTSRGCASSYSAWNNVADKMFGFIKAGMSVYSHYKEDMFQCELDTSIEDDLSDQEYIGAPGVESSHE